MNINLQKKLFSSSQHIHEAAKSEREREVGREVIFFDIFQQRQHGNFFLRSRTVQSIITVHTSEFVRPSRAGIAVYIELIN